MTRGRRARIVGVLALSLSAACGSPSAAPLPSAGSPSPASSPASAPASAPASPSPASSVPSSPASAVSAPTLIAFGMVSGAGTGGAAEVSGPDQVDRLAGAPPEVVAEARAAVARYRGNRMFAFVLPGCRNTGATLTLGAARITAALTGGEGIACFVAEWFLAVFAVPADRVPPGARVG